MIRKPGDHQRCRSLRELARLAVVLPLMGSAANATAQDDVAAQLGRAAAFHNHADYAQSVPILRKIVEHSPRDYEANLLLGEDLLASGNTQAAVDPLLAACDLRPSDGTAEVYLADAEAALGAYPEAAQALQSGIARSNGAGPFLQSWAAFCLKRFQMLESSLRSTRLGEATAFRVEAAILPEGSEGREKLLERAAAEGPEQRGIWGELGTAQLERGEPADAQKSLAEAQRRGPQQAETLQLEALLAAMANNWAEAEEKLTELAAKSPAEMQSAVALWRHVLAPRRSIAANPIDAAAWDCLRDTRASCPQVSTQSHEALSAKDLYAEGRWEQLIALPPPTTGDRSALLWRGVALAATADCAQAIPSLERGLEADGLTAKFWLDVCYASEARRSIARLSGQGNMAAVHALQGDMLMIVSSDAAGAVLEYSKAVKADPRNSHFLEKLAEADRTTGDRDGAQQAAAAALALDAHSFSALQTLAMLAIKERKYTEALARLKQLLAIDPNDQWTLVELGVAHGQLGQPDEAVHYLGPQLAAGYADPKGALHAMLANALSKLGRDDEAKQAAATAAQLANASLESGQLGGTDAHQ